MATQHLAEGIKIESFPCDKRNPEASRNPVFFSIKRFDRTEVLHVLGPKVV
jgi:hypothetical protein